MATRKATSSPQEHQTSPRSPASCCSGAPASGGAEMFGEFQDWCLRTYGDSGKTKTVTRRKYNKILQTLLQGDEENNNGVFQGNNHINAKFKFWVKSKGFRVGTLQDAKTGSSDRQVVYVPIKATVSGQRFICVSGLERFPLFAFGYEGCVCVCVITFSGLTP